VASVEIRDMQPSDEYYVSCCTHVNESDDIDEAAAVRLAFLRGMHDAGLRAKVALLEGRHVGFLYVMPIEVCPWGPLGSDLAAVPCLFVVTDEQGAGIGRALLEAGEGEARRQGMKGVTLQALHSDFWFMPASFFEKHGYEEIDRRGRFGLLWKPFDPKAVPPRFLTPSYTYEPVPGKAVVDLFWNAFCETSAVETLRVREVAAEFGDAVVLNEYPAEDREVLLRHQIPRAIYVNGEEIGWGHEAPREGIREAITKALAVG